MILVTLAVLAVLAGASSACFPNYAIGNGDGGGAGDDSATTGGDSGHDAAVGAPDATTGEAATDSPTDGTPHDATAGDTGVDTGPTDASIELPPAPSCDAGDGAAVALYMGGSPHAIAVDSTNVYWTDISNDAVYTCPKCGCTTPTTIFVSDAGRPPEGIAVDGTYVYWGGNSLPIQRCPTPGCAGGPELVAATTIQAESMTLDSQNVYWGGCCSGIESVAKDGGTVATLSGNLNGQGSPRPGALTLGSGLLFWDDISAFAIESCPTTNCTSPTVIAQQDGGWPRGIALDGANVYWVDYNLGTVSSCPRGTTCGGAPNQIATGQNSPVAVATDGVNVFWANYGVGQIWRCPIGGCYADGGGPVQLADGTGDIYEMTVDSTYVYWTTQPPNTAAVWRVAK